MGFNFCAVAAEEEELSVPKVQLAMWVCVFFVHIYLFIINLVYIIKTKDGKEKLRGENRSWY